MAAMFLDYNEVGEEVDFKMMFKQADQLLYEAKNAGRDRYVIKVIE